MANLFGTDGVRGKAGVVLTAELALKLGQAAGQAFIKANGGKSGIVVIGRDTRISGQMLEAALTAGLTS
ncbi:MAG: phosphoglucosamine mutase, partial [Peptococcaceae bacterium]